MIISENRLNINLNSYDTIDNSIAASREFIRSFGTEEDYVEAHIYNLSGVLLESNYDYKEYRIPGSLQGAEVTLTNELEFSPGNLVQSLGYIIGSYRVNYNILRKKVFNTNQPIFFIKEISSDRRELRISTNYISSQDVQNGVVNFINEIQTSPYFKDYLLNFGNNKLVNAINIGLDTSSPVYTILVKLYQPLPTEFSENDTFWFVEELADPVVYQVEVAPQIEETKIPYLKSANFDIDLDQKNNSSSDYYNNSELLSSPSIFSYQELINKLNQQSIQINVDYTDYSTFAHFSSAKRRLLNFVKKLEDIEQYTTNLNLLSTNPYSGSYAVSQSADVYKKKISDIVTKFDGYENYLYYESSSKSWPKSGSRKPYTLYPTTSSEAIQWLGTDDYNSQYYGGELYSSSFYDEENQNNLVYSIPEYLRIDPSNELYDQFIEMIGQHFDNIWIYIKSITDLQKASNSLNRGISKDLVYFALRSLGIKLYNSKANDDLYSYLIGSNVSGSYTPTTESYTQYVSSSEYIVPGQDIQKEILKRIYHNAPDLLKKKGTDSGVSDLISIFGIPNTVLSINTFGGADKNTQTVDYTYDRFSYALYTSGSNIQLGWHTLYAPASASYVDYVPDSIEFRFKPQKGTYYNTSSILELLVSGTHERSMGMIIKPDLSVGYPYSQVSFLLSGSEGMAVSRVSVPLYYTSSTGEQSWWNVLLKREYHYSGSQNTLNQTYKFYIANKIDTRVGHIASGSIFVNGVPSSSYNRAWTYPEQTLYLGGSLIQEYGEFETSASYKGYLQELRYWSCPLSESSFYSHVLNPESIQGNDSSSAYLDLVARFPLGNNLIVYNHYETSSVQSTHPNYSNRIFYTSSYNQSASFYRFPDQNNYQENNENYSVTTPNSVYSSPVTEKIRIVDNHITGSVLSPILRLEDEDVYRTKDIHLVEIAFSPQDEINKDIIANYGNTIDIDQYIGDPRDAAKKQYDNLVGLSNQYYQKYKKSYNLQDYVRLIQFYDNALFKMVLDFLPARDNISTGLNIKSPILERPKEKTPQMSGESIYNNYTSDITGSKIEGDSIYRSGVGDGSDFYTGQLQGSEIDVKQIFDTKNRNPYLWQ